MMGAYTAATASTFNSLPIPRIAVFNQYSNEHGTE
jgi:diaminopimelate decarboxylase